MKYWESGLVVTILLVAGLLLAAELIRRFVPLFRKLGIPGSIIAGVLGLALGPSAAQLLPLDTDVLESAVYHGLAIAFIAVGLQTPPAGRKGGGSTSMAFAIPWLLTFQAALGLAIVLLLGGLHPGLGALLPLGFQQGPGQALSLGAAWEASGLENGAQIGLIIAAFGFAWSVFCGVPLVAWGRKRGLIAPLPPAKEATQNDTRASLPPGSLELATRQAVAIGIVYLATYGIVRFLSGLNGLSDLAWGFHFLVGTLIALPTRVLVNKMPGPTPLDDKLLGRIAGITVDFITCSALAAIQISVLTANLVPILVLTTVAGLCTLFCVVWLSRRAFPDAPFEHCVVLFGAATGTLPMGLALLRIIDPELRSPAPISAVLGSIGAIIGSAPVVVVFLPRMVASWTDGTYPGAGWMWLGICIAYVIALTIGWRLIGPLRFHKPIASFWPTPK